MDKLFLLYAVPLLLAPGVIAVIRRKRSRILICVLNIVLIPAVPSVISLLFSFPSLSMVAPKGLLTIASLVAVWLALLHAALARDVPAPEELDEPVSLVAYDADWVANFSAENARVVDTLGLHPSDIEHIGSTAVPGLPAKPVIDMMLGVAKLAHAREAVSRLQILGYQDMGEAGVPGRVYLRMRGGTRDFNLHIVERGAEHWTNNLALRELLRADPAARARYAEAKARALEAGSRLVAYSNAKSPVLSELIAQARQG